MDVPSNALFKINVYKLYPVSMTLLDATKHILSFSHVLYICTNFLPPNMFWHEWWRLVKPCKDLLYIICFKIYAGYITLFEAT
jgi:hypothetical protein